MEPIVHNTVLSFISGVKILSCLLIGTCNEEKGPKWVIALFEWTEYCKVHFDVLS